MSAQIFFRNQHKKEKAIESLMLSVGAYESGMILLFLCIFINIKLTYCLNVTTYPTMSPSTNFITTIAGTGGVCAYSGDNNQATSATLNYPTGIVVDSSGIALLIIFIIFVMFSSQYRQYLLRG